MLFENITYESILDHMISKVEKEARQRRMNIDTREGSLIRTALSPVAAEMKQMYIELDEILNESFADTATREFLIKHCKDRWTSVEVEEEIKAKKAIRQGEFNKDVKIGSRFSLNQLNYTVIGKLKSIFELECETPGSVGNYDSGKLIPFDHIDGLTKANLTYVLVNGVDEATKAIRQGEFNKDVKIGSRFSLNQLNYTVIGKLEGIFELECETPGSVGNNDSGKLIPLIPFDYIEGLTKANLTYIRKNGEEEEPTEHLRQRYFDSINSQAFGGNIADYKGKVNKIQGVGGCKVYPPVWKDGGTVKVVIIDSDFHKPYDDVVNSVQNLLDPVSDLGQGLGLGLAPIGHVVKVEAVNETVIDITTQITFKDSLNWNDAITYVKEAIKQYFVELSKDWDKVNWENDQNATLIVRISQIEARILNVNGVIDVQNTYLEQVTYLKQDTKYEIKNKILERNSIPKLGEIYNGSESTL